MPPASRPTTTRRRRAAAARLVGQGRTGLREDKGSKENAAVVQGEAKFEHAFTATTKLLEDLKVTYADVNTYLQNDLALQVKINTKFALSVAYELRHNSAPSAGTKSTDTLSTVNLAYSF